MAESFLSGTVDLPVVGSAPKWAVYGVGGLAAAFVAYKWWSASSGADDVPDPVDPGYSTGGEVLPEVENAYPEDNSVGIGETPPGPTDYGFTGTDNSEWTQYVAIQLTQSAVWEYTDIMRAIGNFLARRALTSKQVEIVQAAIAVAGYPPEGNYTVIRPGGGGDTAHFVAPSGLRLVWAKTHSVGIRWNAVAGADEYRLYVNGSFAEMGNAGENLAAGLDGLSPGTRYTIEVSAVNDAGDEGPKASISATTDEESRDEPDPEPKPKPKPKKRHRTWRISDSNPTLSDLVEAYNRRYDTSHSWRDIWNYNLENRSAATRAILRRRGPNKVYDGSAFYFPY